jgi:hypothetical protein
MRDGASTHTKFVVVDRHQRSVEGLVLKLGRKEGPSERASERLHLLKGAFTLGVKDSSIKSPNTKLVIYYGAFTLDVKSVLHENLGGMQC